MKNVTVKLILFLLVMPILLFAQIVDLEVKVEKPKTEDMNYPLFQKGTSIVDLLPNVYYKSIETERPEMFPGAGTSTYTTNTFNLNYRANYYPWDLTEKLGGGNLGLVAGVHINNSTAKEEGFDDDKTNLFLFELGAQYGRYFGDLPVRAEFTLGFGSYNVSNNDASAFAYNVNVSTFLELGESQSYVMPFLGYAGFSNKFKNSDFKNATGGLVAGVTLVRPMGCGDYSCGFEDNGTEKPYARGTNTLQFLQEGALGIGTNKKTGGGFEAKDGLFGLSIRLADYHYVANNVAVGLGFETEILNKSDNASDYKSNSTDLYVTPRIRGNLPVDGALNHLFVDGSVLFGAMTDKTEFTDLFGEKQESTTKSSTFGWSAGLGYNYPFSDHFSLTFQGEYVSKTHTDKDTDAETIDSGTQFFLGLGYTF